MVERLEATGLDPFELTDDNGFTVASINLGFPVVRTVSAARPDADGEDESTQFFGARAVSLSGFAYSTDTVGRQAVLDRLAAFQRPGVDVYLYFTFEDAERRMRLRASQLGATISRPVFAPVQVSWRAPDGIQEAVDETVETAGASADVEAGRDYDLVYPRVYPASTPVGTFTVTNEGTVNVSPVLRLYGPCTNPRIENQTTGQALEFTANGGVTLASGEYVEVDVKERTVRLNGDATQSRYNRLDVSSSEWWQLVPGDNDLRYYPETFTSPASAEVRFRSAWL